HVAPLVDQTPAPYLANLVDAVGKLVAAVLDRDARFGVRQIAAVHICNAGHYSSALAYSQCLELAMQRGTLHPDKFRGARNIAAEAADLRHQVFALEHLP